MKNILRNSVVEALKESFKVDTVSDKSVEQCIKIVKQAILIILLVLALAVLLCFSIVEALKGQLMTANILLVLMVIICVLCAIIVAKMQKTFYVLTDGFKDKNENKDK